MTEREPFTHAIPNASVRKDIALAVRSGIPVDQLAAEFNISPSTVRAYAAEWEDVQHWFGRSTTGSVSRSSSLAAAAVAGGGSGNWVSRSSASCSARREQIMCTWQMHSKNVAGLQV